MEFDFFKPERPSVYLDQWVWIRLARAEQGRPADPEDIQILAAIRGASEAGVAFPLSVTHYIETLSINDPRQRADLAKIMASISYCRTLRSTSDLFRHQFLLAMHQQFGKPYFRPAAPQVLGTGVFWAFLGGQAPLRLHHADGTVVDLSDDPKRQELIRRASQWAEVQFLAGPRDGELAALRQRGYKPEATQAIAQSRLAWETTYVDLLSKDSISREELRVRVMARELIHEHLDLFNDVMNEYYLDPYAALGIDPLRPGDARKSMIEFANRIPTMRIAIDLKTELFRNPQKPWSTNAVQDIDAMSRAVPYCDAVLPDQEVADWLTRSKAGERHNTQIVKRLRDLPSALEPLIERARVLEGDITGWDWAGPGSGFSTEAPWPNSSNSHIAAQ
jgi:hypothetical protein